MFVSARFAALAGNLVDEQVVHQIQSVIGIHTFGAVPVIGRSGPLGVVLFVKPGESGFAPADRDLLVAYADRVGAALESDWAAAGGSGRGTAKARRESVWGSASGLTH